MSIPHLLSRKAMGGAALASFLAVASVAMGCFNVDPPQGTLEECVKNGGLCLPAGECVPSGGQVTGGCFFGQGDAECCQGSPPQPSADDCEGQGGLCVVASDCVPGKGYFTVKGASCGAPDHACCVPHAVCGDATFECCGTNAGGYRYPETCDNGVIGCPEFSAPQPLGSCQNK
jgi:hypothetical protein